MLTSFFTKLGMMSWGWVGLFWLMLFRYCNSNIMLQNLFTLYIWQSRFFKTFPSRAKEGLSFFTKILLLSHLLVILESILSKNRRFWLDEYFMRVCLIFKNGKSATERVCHSRRTQSRCWLREDVEDLSGPETWHAHAGYHFCHIKKVTEPQWKVRVDCLRKKVGDGIGKDPASWSISHFLDPDWGLKHSRLLHWAYPRQPDHSVQREKT